MNGYLNLFDEECYFVKEGARLLKEGDRMILRMPEHYGQEVTLQRSEGRWILQGDGVQLDRVQGVLVDFRCLEEK